MHSTDHAALDALRRLDVTLREVELPDLPVDSMMAPLNAESAAAFEELTLSGRDDLLRRQIRNAWPNSFRESRNRTSCSDPVSTRRC